MRYLKSWKLFEFKETESNTPLLYKDDNLEIKVVKTFDACKEQGKDTRWCSNMRSGFYKHNITANMYRFNFKDGYKLRLTWDYIDFRASTDGYAGGTHWGSGGKVNGKEIHYNYIRPEDESEPFLFDYNKGDQRQEMVNRINSIPQEAIDAIHEYQDKSSKEKSALVNTMYNEISKIKVLDVEITKDEGYPLLVKINYNGNTYDLKMDQFGYLSEFSEGFKKFKKDFKNKYAFDDTYKTLKKYLIDKVSSILKSKKVNESLDLDTIDDILLDVIDNHEFTTLSWDNDYVEEDGTKKDIVVVVIKRNEASHNEFYDDIGHVTEEGKESIKRLLYYIESKGLKYKMEFGTDNIPPGGDVEQYNREFKKEELDDDIDMYVDEYIRIEIIKN